MTGASGVGLSGAGTLRPMGTRIVHVMRHGQVLNPHKVLYGRLPGFGLSELGHRMAGEMAQFWQDKPLTHLRSSPLQRALETMTPSAQRHPHLDVVVDERLIEAANLFEGRDFSSPVRAVLTPRLLPHLWNPLRPSWGEPYPQLVHRMRAAVFDAAEAAGEGGQALLVSHQLPIWTLRRAVEGLPLPHDPRRRQCALVSVTSFTLRDGDITAVDYREPAGHLVPRNRRWRVGT